MKNFEKYIEKIALGYRNGDSGCFITAISNGLCFDCTVSCSDCFKKWALEEAGEKDKEAN